MTTHTMRRMLLTSLMLLVSACGGGGGGGNDGYLLGGGNEGTGGISVKSVQITGSVIDEAAQAVSGATAIINDTVATPINQGRFSAPVTLAAGARDITIAVDRGTLGTSVVTITAIDSAEHEAVNALISVNKNQATLEDVEIVKRGSGQHSGGRTADELQAINELVNDRSGTDKNSGSPQDDELLTPPDRRPELNPDEVDL